MNIMGVVIYNSRADLYLGKGGWISKYPQIFASIGHAKSSLKNRWNSPINDGDIDNRNIQFIILRPTGESVVWMGK